MHSLSATCEGELRQLVGGGIYQRGKKYHLLGAVRSWKLAAHGESILSAEGSVEGSDTYTVLLNYDCAARTFTRTDCSCPYQLGCKHIVALGLHLIDLLRAFESTHDEDTLQNTGAETRDAILDFARTEYHSDETLVLGEKGHESIRSASVPTQSLAPRELKSECYIRLSHDLTPSLAQKASFYPYASVSELLQRDLPDAERALLIAIKEGQFDARTNRTRDLFALVELIEKSGLAASLRTPFDSPLTFSTATTPLKGTLKHLHEPYYDGMRDSFILEMPGSYWKKGAPAPVFVAGENSLAHIQGTQITLYAFPSALARVVARVRETWSGEIGSASRVASRLHGHRATLTGEEVMHLEALQREARESMLSNESTPTFSVNRSTRADPAIAIDYDVRAETLTTAPIIDYGCLQQDVSQSIQWSMTGGRRHLALRKNWAHEVQTHRIKVDGSVVHIAPINLPAEIDLYARMQAEAGALGFSPTLKCALKGTRKIQEYLKHTLPSLAAFASREKMKLLFMRDSVAYESAFVRADFAVDMNEAKDWLHFDLALYCNGERLTLDDIITFIESGETIFRHGNKLLEITNRDELERLVAMLRSFHKREEGFEGKLYHAAELQYVMTSSAHYSAERAKSFQEFLHKVHAGKPVEEVPIPASFASILRPYQKDGVHWLHFLRSYRFAGILADDMGLGKTVQTLALLSMNRIPGEPSLVVCPKSLLFNWHNETRTFAPDMKVLVYEGSPRERAQLRERIADHDLIIISYNTLKKDEQHFVHDDRIFNYVALDEAQFIKNHATKSAQIAKRLNARFRLALTGTPLENNVSEIWSVFDFLMPGFLGQYADFAKRFHKPIMDQSDAKALAHLRAKITPFMLRRTKGEVLKELPAKIEQDIVAELGVAQNVLYQQILAQVKSEVFQTIEKKGFKKSQIHILAGLMKLRQVCNHPALLIEKEMRNKHTYESAKLELALELIDEAVAGGHKVLLFSQFTSMLDIIVDELDKREIKHLYLSGKTRDRQALIEKFNTGTIPLFLISLKAGGTGLNLTTADTVIIFDPWWNPSVEMQAADRAHRIGQTKTVNVYRLVTKGTIEEKIQELKHKKKALADALVNSTGDLFSKLTWDDVRELFV